VQELNELQAVSLPEHLVSSRLAQAVKVRIPVSLSKYSHEVLMHHLQSCRLYLLLGIINDHIRLKVTPPPPSSAVQLAMCADVWWVGGGGGGICGRVAISEKIF